MSSKEALAAPERVNWGNPIEFVLSCISYAVGLGNVWRFPYLCYRNGGGAFLLPYLLMLFAMGLPIFFMEMALGQYCAFGPIQTFQRISPIFQGVGYSTMIIIFIITLYYQVIIAWSLFYLFASFSAELGWGSCDHDFNTMQCYSEAANDRCLQNSTETDPMMFLNRSCYSVRAVCEEYGMTYNDPYSCLAPNSTTIRLHRIVNRTLASYEYYRDYAMGINGATWENFGEPRWQMVLCLLLSWIIAFGCLIKGVKSTGKVVYFTTIFPYVVMLAMLIRGATLEGSLEGVIYYIKPDFSKLASASVWGDAASQTFYALGIGCGSLITLASYNKFDNNCHRDAFFVSITNFLTAVFAGFGVFAILGFMAREMGQSVADVVASGPGLAFVVYPEAVLRMPLPQLWSVLFFLMLFTLGLGSQFAGVEAISTAIVDNWPHLQRYKYAVTGSICATCFVLALPMCCNGGIYLFTVVDDNIANWNIFLIGIAELGVVAWVYGIRRFLKDLETMGMKLFKFTYWYWYIAISILSPIFLLFVVIFVLSSLTPSYYENYVFPEWVSSLSWLIGISTIVPIPAFALYRWVRAKEVGMELLGPSPQWGPASKAAMAAATTQSVNGDSIYHVGSELANMAQNHVYENQGFDTQEHTYNNVPK